MIAPDALMTDIPMNSATEAAQIAPTDRYRRLGDVIVDSETRCVLREGQATRLEPRVFTLLLYFMENPGREISRRELGERVWNGVHVVDEAIQRAISVLRQALGDTPKQGLHIQTTTNGGYRLVSEMASVRAQSLEPPANWRNLAIAAAAGVLAGVLLTTLFSMEEEVTPTPSAAPVARTSSEEPTPTPSPPEAIAPRAP
jgi:DNA-binding winged helix-turn-helix (wHTH) protein